MKMKLELWDVQLLVLEELIFQMIFVLELKYLSLGQMDIEAEWDGYVKHLYDIGLQDVIDEGNDAYQAIVGGK